MHLDLYVWILFCVYLLFSFGRAFHGSLSFVLKLFYICPIWSSTSILRLKHMLFSGWSWPNFSISCSSHSKLFIFYIYFSYALQGDTANNKQVLCISKHKAQFQLYGDKCLPDLFGPYASHRQCVIASSDSEVNYCKMSKNYICSETRNGLCQGNVNNIIY